MADPEYLADKSALARVSIPTVAAVLVPLIESGQMGCCGVAELEVRYSYSARSHQGLVDTLPRSEDDERT